MDKSIQKGINFADIRQTIRRVILPLVQAIYDENPSDVILFCFDYFNDLQRKREAVLENVDHQNLNCTEEIIQKKEEVIKKQIVIEESKEMENFPTNIRSTSDPLLTKDKQSEVVNLRGTSSWDTPSNLTEPIKSLEMLKDTICGIGDQPSSGDRQTGSENSAKAGDTNARLKNERAFEDDNFIENTNANDLEKGLKGEYYQNGSEDEDLKILCTKFEGLKTSEMLDTVKLEESTHDISDQDVTQGNDIKEFKKQLSPSSSFGFIPHLNDYDSEEKINSESSDGEDAQSKTEEMKVLATNISETFHNLANEMSCAETNFNYKIQTAEEISDIIERRSNERAMDPESNQISRSRNNFIEETNAFKSSLNSTLNSILNNLNKRGIKNGDNAQDRKIAEHSISLEAADKNKSQYLDLCKELKESKLGFTEQLNSQYEEFPNEEKPECILFDDKVVEDYKPDCTESESAVDKSWRKRWNDAHSSSDSFNSVQRRDATFQSTQFSSNRPNFGEAGDVLHHRYHTRVNNDYMNRPLRNEITPESSTGIREFSYSRLYADQYSRRSIGGRPFENLPERKISSENVSNANPQSIPYSWRKLNKQSHSSEKVVNYSKESQILSNDEVIDCVSEMNTSTGNETEPASETSDENECEETFFEASDEIRGETNLGIEEAKVEISKQQDDNDKAMSAKLINNQPVKNGQAQRESLSETDISTYLNKKSQSKEHFYNQDGFKRNQKITEMNEKPQNATEGVMDVEVNGFGHNGAILNAQKDKAVNQHSDHSLKEELGLNAACGDFVSFINGANGQDMDSQTTVPDSGKNKVNIKLRNDGSTGEISKEFVEEVIGVIIEQQKNDLNDSFDSLNFSSYLEIDSSNSSSNGESNDYSETEESNINDSIESK